MGAARLEQTPSLTCIAVNAGLQGGCVHGDIDIVNIVSIAPSCAVIAIGVGIAQDQKLHTEAAADAQTDETSGVPPEVAGHCRHSLPQNLYQLEG